MLDFDRLDQMKYDRIRKGFRNLVIVTVISTMSMFAVLYALERQLAHQALVNQETEATYK